MQKKAKKLGSVLALFSDESINLWELSLDMHTLCVEKKPFLSPLSIERLLGSEKGGGDQQMIPELLKEAFSAKPHNKNLENTIKNPMIACFRRTLYKRGMQQISF